MFQLILCDPNDSLCECWRAQFSPWPGVEVRNCCFEEAGAFDCMVSAANSFGIMDGGVDYAITEYFGARLQDRVQEHIVEEYLGEQPVGTAFVLPTGHADIPFLCHTPTMRIPLSIARTDNVYRAMWAMLLAVRRFNLENNGAVGSVLCPGLGTGTGRMRVDEAAYQMALAWSHFVAPPPLITWEIAKERQNRVWYGSDWGYQSPRRRIPLVKDLPEP